MNLIDIFALGLYFENIFVWHAVGLGMIILFSYTMEEYCWVIVRFFIFLMIQVGLLLALRPLFDVPGKELFLLLVLIGCEAIVSVPMDILLKPSTLSDPITGFIRRGDAILPLVLSSIIAKNFDPAGTVVYSIGIALGFAGVLGVVTAISIKFNFNRLHPRHTYALKLILLGIFSIISY